MANYSALVHQKKSRAFYRVQATRMMIGAGNILKKHAAEHSRHTGQEDDLATCSHISFESAHYQCTENCGSLSLGVILEGGTGQNTFYVDFCTENGSANAGADYEFSEGTLVFKPGEIHKEIKVSKEKIMQKLKQSPLHSCLLKPVCITMVAATTVWQTSVWWLMTNASLLVCQKLLHHFVVIVIN